MINANYSPWKRVVRGLLEGYLWIAGLLVALIAVVPKLSGVPQEFTPLASWATTEGWWAIPVVAVTGAAAKLGRDRLDASWTWSLIQDVLDRIAREAFRGVEGPVHYHRATLFRHQWCWWPTPPRSVVWPWGKGRWPCSGWLVPIVRSGHATQRSKTVFLAPDDADSTEGVAGAVWSSDKEITIQVPKAIDHTSTQEHAAHYSSKTLVTVAWIQRQVGDRKVLAASFRGIPVEVKGQKWGVLLLDSRDPQAAVNANLNMSHHAYLLGKLLERTKV